MANNNVLDSTPKPSRNKIIPIQVNEAMIKKQEDQGISSTLSMGRFIAYRPGNNPKAPLIKTRESVSERVPFKNLRDKPREMLVRFGLFGWFIWDADEAKAKAQKDRILALSRNEARAMDAAAKALEAPKSDK